MNCYQLLAVALFLADTHIQAIGKHMDHVDSHVDATFYRGN